MDELDEKIRQALKDSGGETLDPEEYDTLLGLTRTIMKSHWRGWFMLTYVCAFVAFGLEVYCAVKFFGATETRWMLAYGFGFMWCTALFLMMKLWIWMQMDKNSVKLEIKRLQLLVAHALETKEKK